MQPPLHSSFLTLPQTTEDDKRPEPFALWEDGTHAMLGISWAGEKYSLAWLGSHLNLP